MENYSTTQTTNLVAIAGVIGLILNKFHVNIGNDEIMGILSGSIAVIGILSNWLHRYKQGDLKLSGIRK